MKPTTPTTENPLYEKLCSRFSYSGKTVGEMMLCRAREAGFVTAPKHTDLKEITVESCVTRANSLPRAAAVAAPVVARPLFSAHRINPCAALAVVLFFFILAYLLFAGISHRIPGFSAERLAAPTEEVQFYEASVADRYPL